MECFIFHIFLLNTLTYTTLMVSKRTKCTKLSPSATPLTKRPTCKGRTGQICQKLQVISAVAGRPGWTGILVECDFSILIGQILQIIHEAQKTTQWNG